MNNSKQKQLAEATNLNLKSITLLEVYCYCVLIASKKFSFNNQTITKALENTRHTCPDSTAMHRIPFDILENNLQDYSKYRNFHCCTTLKALGDRYEISLQGVSSQEV